MAAMSRPQAARIRLVLALLLALGPLQAQVAFACAMLDAVVQGDCCCDGAGDPGCQVADCDPDAASAGGPCCERSVNLQVAAPADQDVPSGAPAVFRSGLDPPDAALPPALLLSTAPPTGREISRPTPRPGTHPGNDLYLTTLRLRI